MSGMYVYIHQYIIYSIYQVYIIIPGIKQQQYSVVESCCENYLAVEMPES